MSGKAISKLGARGLLNRLIHISTAELTGFLRDAVALTVNQAACFLGVCPSLLYSYIEQKQIPNYRMMGRSIRF